MEQPWRRDGDGSRHQPGRRASSCARGGAGSRPRRPDRAGSRPPGGVAPRVRWVEWRPAADARPSGRGQRGARLSHEAACPCSATCRPGQSCGRVGSVRPQEAKLLGHPPAALSVVGATPENQACPILARPRTVQIRRRRTNVPDAYSRPPAASVCSAVTAHPSGCARAEPSCSRPDPRSHRSASVRAPGPPAVVRRSLSPSMSASGVLVAFGSFAANLVAGDTNGAPDVFVARPSPER